MIALIWTPLPGLDGRMEQEFGPLTQVMANILLLPPDIPPTPRDVMEQQHRLLEQISFSTTLPLEMMALLTLQRSLRQAGVESIVVPPVEMAAEHYREWMRHVQLTMDRGQQRQEPQSVLMITPNAKRVDLVLKVLILICLICSIVFSFYSR